MSDLVHNAKPVHDASQEESESSLSLGDWFYVTDEDDGVDRLACCTHVGSNYAEMTFINNGSIRVHFDTFNEMCKPAADADAYIQNAIKEKEARIGDLMKEVRLLTDRLGVTRGALGAGESEGAALALHSSEPVHTYKANLVRAKTEELPALFKEIEEESQRLKMWMSAQMIPLKAKFASSGSVIKAIEKRIFSVELYAGLVEDVVEVRAGEPAPMSEKIRLFQRRCYMDEECLIAYEHGGMKFKDIHAFDAWIAKPANFQRILPFPRTVVAFRVRRKTRNEYDEDDVADFGGLIHLWQEEQKNALTYLYMRNGERLYRISTGIEFDEKLFPDLENDQFKGKIYVNMFCYRVNKIITEAQYQGILEEENEIDRWYKKAEKSLSKEDLEHELWRKHAGLRNKSRDFFEYSPDNVHFDDIRGYIGEQMEKHNRLVLVLQGILDRSPIFHPHPPWQLWSGGGFQSALELVYDDARAMVAGERPNFEAYQARLNASLRVGSITVGQEDCWRRQQAGKYREEMLRRGGRDHGFWPKRYSPDGDPGPGLLARVSAIRVKQCSYRWTREKKDWRLATSVAASCRVPFTMLLNVDAYKPGDFRQFYADPRTRAEYMKWAPMLLVAEDFHAGKRALSGPHNR